MATQLMNGYALLVGVNENNVAQWSLPDVAKDIDALKQVLTHPERCAYPTDNLKVITGEEATRKGILDGLDWLQERLKNDSSGNATAVIYYSGHGWIDEINQTLAYYLIPYDVREYSIKSSALRAEDLTEAIAALNPQRLLVILDCCHSGGMEIKEAMSIPSGYASAAIPANLLIGKEKAISTDAGAKGLEGLVKGSGRAVLSSSQAEQPSYMRKDGRMSIFTYHLIEALTGHAQPQEGAAEVLVSDVMSHVYRYVPKSAKTDWNKDQQPEYQVSGNFPIALLLGGKGLSKGQSAPDPLTPISSVEPSGKLEQNTTINIHQEQPAIQGDQTNIGQMSGGFLQPNMNAKVVQQAARDMTIHERILGIDGAVSTGGGDVAGVMYKQGLDVEELVTLLKQVLPKNDPRPEQFRKVIKQFQTYHQTLYEWKELHNALDDIITSFAQFSSEVQRADAERTIPSLKTLRNLWYAVCVKVDALLDFARTLKYIGKQYTEAGGQLTGENWAVKISDMHSQINLQIGLNEASGFDASIKRSMNLLDRSKLKIGVRPDWWVALCELNNEFNHVALGQMHWADKKLRETATELYNLSQSVFGSES